MPRADRAHGTAGWISDTAMPGSQAINDCTHLAAGSIFVRLDSVQAQSNGGARWAFAAPEGALIRGFSILGCIQVSDQGAVGIRWGTGTDQQVLVMPFGFTADKAGCAGVVPLWSDARNRIDRSGFASPRLEAFVSCALSCDGWTGGFKALLEIARAHIDLEDTQAPVVTDVHQRAAAGRNPPDPRGSGGRGRQSSQRRRPQPYVVPTRATTVTASAPPATPSNGRGATRAAQLRITSPVRRVSSTKPFSVAGRLVDAESKPIAGAALLIQKRTFFPKVGGYIQGIQRCDEATLAHNVKVVVLPLASSVALTPDETQALKEEIDAAHEHGANVVAAAGNNNGLPVSVPATAAGVLSVGASDTATGGLCPFSAIGALLLAPGCGLDGADPSTGAARSDQQGTSYAAVIAATALAALRTWRPDLSPAEAERLLSETGTKSAAGPLLDLTAVFAAVGLAGVAGPAPAPPPVSTSIPQPTPRPPAKPRLVTPKLTVGVSSLRSGKRTLTARARNRPRGARLSITIYASGHRGMLRRVASRTRASATVRVRVRSWKRVTAKFTDTTGNRLTSRVATVNAHR